GAQIQALVFARGNPGAVDGDELTQRLDVVLLRKLRQCQTAGRALQAARILLGTEGVAAPVRVAVRLDALEDLLAVVQDSRRGVEREGAVGTDARGVPAARRGPADVDRVVGEVDAEPGVREDLGASGIA